MYVRMLGLVDHGWVFCGSWLGGGGSWLGWLWVMAGGVLDHGWAGCGSWLGGDGSRLGWLCFMAGRCWIMVGLVVGHGWGVLDHGWVFCGSCLGGSRACQAAERAGSVASAAARRGGLDPAETGEPRLVSLICERDIGGARARVQDFPQEVSGHVNGTRSFTYLCTKLNAFEQVST